MYLLIVAQFFLDRYTTTDPVWSFWLSKVRWCGSLRFSYFYYFYKSGSKPFRWRGPNPDLQFY